MGFEDEHVESALQEIRLRLSQTSPPNLYRLLVMLRKSRPRVGRGILECQGIARESAYKFNPSSILECERFSRFFARRRGDCGRPLRRRPKCFAWF
jgi:hypothetical protein